jgi:heat shock protein HtpX
MHHTKTFLLMFALIIVFMFFGGRRNNNGAGALLQLVAIIFAPLAAILIKMTISRSREYIADQTGGEISGNPEGLAKLFSFHPPTAERIKKLRQLK